MTHAPRVAAIIALGSNLAGPCGANPRANVLAGLRRLQEISIEPLKASSLYETAPVDCPPGSPPFANAVAILVPLPGETPESLLGKLQAIEREFGRKPKTLTHESRPLDLDIIVFGAETRSGSRLAIPHPRAHLRQFVLEPLAEVAPDLVMPGQTRTVRQLLQRLGTLQ